jgi:hypothetical protein
VADFLPIFLATLLPLAARGGTSADYSIRPVALDGGGVLGSSEAYTVNPSTGEGGAGASADYAIRGGYAGQLLDVTSIAIDAPSPPPTLDERATWQLGVTAFHDDASRTVLTADQVDWSVQSGPLAGIDSGGLVTAASVYRNAPAVARASYGGVSATGEITVVNTGVDDFAPYAADGFEDSWQVRYFGEAGTFGGAASNPDSDDLDNLQEFAFGTDPTLASGDSVRWSGSTLQATGLPVPYAFKSSSGFTFRAVFSRRRDFAAFGLSYTVEFSGDLATWRASTATPSVLADDGEFQVVSVPYPFFVNGRKATFFRVKVLPPLSP